MDEAVEQRLAPEAAARQQPARSAMPSGRLASIAHSRHLEAEPDRRPLLGLSASSPSAAIQLTPVHVDPGAAGCRQRWRVGAQDREALFLEQRPGLGRLQKRGRPRHRRSWRVGGQRDRIDDRRMRIVREGADDLHASARRRRRSGRRCRAAPRRARPAAARRARSRPARSCLRPTPRRRAFPARPCRICRPARHRRWPSPACRRRAAWPDRSLARSRLGRASPWARPARSGCRAGSSACPA